MNPTPWKIDMERNNGGGWKMMLLFKGVIFRFNMLVVRGFWYKGGIARSPP